MSGPTAAGATGTLLVGLAVAGADGRLVDFDESFASMMERGGVVAHIGDDVRELVRSAVAGDDRMRLDESASLRAGSVVYRLISDELEGADAANFSAASGLRGGAPLSTLNRVVGELAEHDELLSVREAISDTLASVLRARRTNERRIRAHRDEVEAQSAALADINSTLLSLSTTDALTGLFNRRGFDAVASTMWDSARDHTVPLGAVLLDIDRFKAFNDTFGHLRGDECLRTVSAALARTSRSVDVVARFGGEEFIVLVAAADSAACGRAAERLRAAVEELALPHPAGGVVTVSGGHHSVVPTAASSVLELIDHADRALYEAKRLGRNRVSP